MVRYWYVFTPLVIVGALMLLALPWLALFALALIALVALVALVGLAWAIVTMPYVLGRAFSRRWQARRSASPRTAAVLSPADSGVRRIRSVPAGAAVFLANPPSERDT
jgi:Na+/glutamate symporter